MGLIEQSYQQFVSARERLKNPKLADLKIAVENALREEPGRYPLEYLRGSVDQDKFGIRSVINFGFTYTLGSDKFTPHFPSKLGVQIVESNTDLDLLIKGLSDYVIFLPKSYKIPLIKYTHHDDGLIKTEYAFWRPAFFNSEQNVRPKLCDKSGIWNSDQEQAVLFTDTEIVDCSKQ